MHMQFLLTEPSWACDKMLATIIDQVKWMGSVTNVLNQGSLAAALADKELQVLLYQELKIIASAKLRKQGGLTTNTTSLVHEAFLKLNQTTGQKQWSNRHHFFSTAAIAMRHILVDQARTQLREKRGGGNSPTEWHDNLVSLEQECSQLVALNQALDQLQQIDSQLVDLVNLRYFVGLSMQETADIMGTSLRTTERQWQKIKVMLQLWLGEA